MDILLTENNHNRKLKKRIPRYGCSDKIKIKLLDTFETPQLKDQTFSDLKVMMGHTKRTDPTFTIVETLFV